MLEFWHWASLDKDCHFQREITDENIFFLAKRLL